MKIHLAIAAASLALCATSYAAPPTHGNAAGTCAAGGHGTSGTSICADWYDSSTSSSQHIAASAGNVASSSNTFKFCGATSLQCLGISVDCTLELDGQFSIKGPDQVGIIITGGKVSGGGSCRQGVGGINLKAFPWLTGPNDGTTPVSGDFITVDAAGNGLGTVGPLAFDALILCNVSNATVRNVQWDNSTSEFIFNSPFYNASGSPIAGTQINGRLGHCDDYDNLKIYPYVKP